MIYFAIVKLRCPVRLDESALGIEIPVSIGSRNLRFFTPRLVETDADDNDHFRRVGKFKRSLGAPIPSSKFFRADADIFWGEIWGGGPNGPFDASVKSFFAILESSDDEPSSLGDEIHEMNGEWLDRFDSFIRLRCRQRGLVVTRVSGDNNSRFQLYRSGISNELIQGKRPNIKVCIDFHAPSDAATRPQLEEVLAMCSQGKVIPLHYDLLLRAYDAHQFGDPRNTVIEAATAMEVAVTKRIRVELKKANVSDQHVDLMLNGHQMLRKRVALLEKLGVSIPLSGKDLENEIFGVRNRVIHGGYQVTLRQANKLIAHVDRVIRDITPEYAETSPP
jgi:hypothetical protein